MVVCCGLVADGVDSCLLLVMRPHVRTRLEEAFHANSSGCNPPGCIYIVILLHRTKHSRSGCWPGNLVVKLREPPYATT
jgi:hypothetical protein